MFPSSHAKLGDGSLSMLVIDDDFNYSEADFVLQVDSDKNLPVKTSTVARPQFRTFTLLIRSTHEKRRRKEFRPNTSVKEVFVSCDCLDDIAIWF